MNLPHFLGIGTQKGGTTYLHALLNEHPQIFLATPKEVHFFSLHYPKGIEWYKNFFKSAAHDQRCGEITPYYMFHPFAVQRIFRHLPNVNLIVLLRDPVERALSQYFHSKRLGLEPLGFQQAFAAEEKRLQDSSTQLKMECTHLSHQQHSYLSRSRYDIQLKALRNVFPSDQIKVYRSESLFSNPGPVWNDVLSFLSLDPLSCPIISPQNVSCSGHKTNLDASTLDWIRCQLSPAYDWIFSEYGIRW